MRRGCISLGETQCHKCHRLITDAERFLAIDEKDGVEVERGKTVYYCVECALQKGYAKATEGRGERIVTFFS